MSVFNYDLFAIFTELIEEIISIQSILFSGIVINSTQSAFSHWTSCIRQYWPPVVQNKPENYRDNERKPGNEVTNVLLIIENETKCYDPWKFYI